MATSTLTRTTGPSDPSEPRPASAAASLLITDDDRLAEAVEPLAAAAGHPLRRIRRPDEADTRWQRAPLVIVGSDAARACHDHGLPDRPGLILCTTLAWFSADPERASLIWKYAVHLRAQHVIALPEATDWLLDRFTRTVRDTTLAPVVATVAGHGGAGATTLALAGATAAAGEGKRVVLIDLDPAGGGIDAAAGLADRPGWRWPSLATGAGQLEPERLLAGLPHRGGLHLIGSDPRNHAEPDTDAFEAVLHAARIGADLVVIDLPRSRTDAAARAAATARTVAVAIGPSQRSWEAARRVVIDYGVHAAHIGTVPRGGAKPRPKPRPDDADLFDELELPQWGPMPTDRRLPERLLQGRLPGRRTARRVNALMAELATTTSRPDEDHRPQAALAGAAR